MQRDRIDFGRMNIPVLFRKIFFPTLLGMVCMACITIADGIFVGRGVGSNALAAVNIVAPIFMVTTGIGLLFGVGGQHQCHTGVASVPLIDGHGNILGDAVQQTDSLYAGKFRSVVAACTGVYELDRAILHLQHAGQHRNVHDPTGRLTEIRDAVQRNSSFDKCRTRLCFRFPDTDGTDRSRAGNRTSTSGRRIDGVGLPVRLFQDIAFI